MKIKDLIEELSKLNQEEEIYTYYSILRYGQIEERTTLITSISRKFADQEGQTSDYPSKAKTNPITLIS
jgi:hypothetical protein